MNYLFDLENIHFMTIDLKDKVVVVTGATSGIGKACVDIFGREGAKVVAMGRNDEKLKLLHKKWKDSGFDFITVKADAAVEEDNRRMIEETINHYGRLDVLIANAGISMRAMFDELELDVFKKVMDVNFYGAVYATKFALPYLLKSKGSIIAISSINGHRGIPARTAYTASKYAMEGFFESLRTEIMKRGVHILVVSPGFTGTNIRNIALAADGKMQGESPRDEAKMMTPEAVAIAVLKGLKAKKRDLILTPIGKLVVFLNKIIPGRLDKLVYTYMAKEPNSPFK